MKGKGRGFRVGDLVWVLDRPLAVAGRHNREGSFVAAFPLPNHPHSGPGLEGLACPRGYGAVGKARTLESNRMPD